MSRISITQFAKTMDHDEGKLVATMKAQAVLQPLGRPYSMYISRGYFIVANKRQGDCNVLLTEKGQIWMARRYPHGAPLGVQ